MDTDPIDSSDSHGAASMARRFRTRYASRWTELASQSGPPSASSHGDNILNIETVSSTMGNDGPPPDATLPLTGAESSASDAADPMQTQRQLMNQFLAAYAAARSSPLDEPVPITLL